MIIEVTTTRARRGGDTDFGGNSASTEKDDKQPEEHAPRMQHVHAGSHDGGGDAIEREFVLGETVDYEEGCHCYLGRVGCYEIHDPRLVMRFSKGKDGVGNCYLVMCRLGGESWLRGWAYAGSSRLGIDVGILLFVAAKMRYTLLRHKKWPGLQVVCL